MVLDFSFFNSSLIKLENRYSIVESGNLFINTSGNNSNDEGSSFLSTFLKYEVVAKDLSNPSFKYAALLPEISIVTVVINRVPNTTSISFVASLYIIGVLLSCNFTLRTTGLDQRLC